MRLRAAVDEVWPVKENEAVLSETARKFIFRGFYGHPETKIIGFDAKPAAGWEAWETYEHVIHRERPAYRYGHPPVFSETHQTVVTQFGGKTAHRELERSRGLARANHVEQVARRIKFAGATLLTIAGVAVYAATEHSSTAPPAHHLTPAESMQYYGLSPDVQMQGGVEAPESMATPSTPVLHSVAPGSINKTGGTVAP